MGAKELDAIAKRVESKCPIEARNGFGVVLYFEAGGSQRFEKIGEFSHEKRGMRLLRRAKLRLNTEVQLQGPHRNQVPPRFARFGGLGISANPEALHKTGEPIVHRPRAWLVEHDRFRRWPRRKLP